MTERTCYSRPAWLLVCCVVIAAAAALAGYKPRPWVIRARENYPAALTSEGVTIAVDPLFKDESAGQVFDKNDIVTRGIMPLAIVIFNDNDFPVAVDGSSVELIQGDEHLRSLPVNEVVHRLYQKGNKGNWLPIPRKPTIDEGNKDALEDFEHKLLGNKNVAAHDKGGGFLYLQIPGETDLAGYLSEARIYIPEIVREDTGAKMMFFEIDLKPAVKEMPAR